MPDTLPDSRATSAFRPDPGGRKALVDLLSDDEFNSTNLSFSLQTANQAARNRAVRLCRILRTEIPEVVTDGTIVDFEVTAGGSGYTSAPTVAVADAPAGGTNAGTPTATINGGEVVSVAVSTGGNLGGEGYRSDAPPAVTFSGGGGSGAEATAVIDFTSEDNTQMVTDILAVRDRIIRELEENYLHPEREEFNITSV